MVLLAHPVTLSSCCDAMAAGLGQLEEESRELDDAKLANAVRVRLTRARETA
jgi:hypothetical protein